jgi:membrane associated rhomboid family serine protease
MGIHDRDYYRSDSPSFLGALVRHGPVCKWLLGVNLACFALQLLTRHPESYSPHDPFTELMVLNVPKVLSGEVWRLLTGAFVHNTLWPWHLICNLLALWLFGPDVEERRGSWEFLAFYLLSAFVANVAYCAGFEFLQLGSGKALGASGAVMAVLLLSAFYDPRKVARLFVLFPVPVWVALLFLAIFDVLDWRDPQTVNLGAAGALGGATFGLLYYKLNWHLTGWLEPRRRLPPRPTEPRLRIYREEDEPAPVTVPLRPTTEDAEQSLEEQVDAILAKISHSGKDSLTEGERQILLRASEAIRRRRN